MTKEEQDGLNEWSKNNNWLASKAIVWQAACEWKNKQTYGMLREMQTLIHLQRDQDTPLCNEVRTYLKAYKPKDNEGDDD